MIDIKTFNTLSLYFEGNSRIIRRAQDPYYLVAKLKPTIFSFKANGPIYLPGIDMVRTKLNDIFCKILHQHEIKTSTVKTENSLILMSKEKVPPIEVVVKSAMVGSPKHLYKKIGDCVTRHGKRLSPGMTHTPYVRFDWRNPLPDEDVCMPSGLANYFIDTHSAEKTALTAYMILKRFLNQYDFDLVDICFFMNETGDVICGEISTDNTQITYNGTDADLFNLFSIKEKERMLMKGQVLLNKMKDASIVKG